MDSNELNVLLEFTKSVNTLISQRAEEIARLTPKDQDCSPDVSELAAAMSAAQAEYSPLVFNKTNPYERWEFNDLNSIMNAVRPALSRNKIFLTQLPCVDDSGATIVYTRLIHASGQWIQCRSRVIPSKNNQHEFDSVLTFQRRAALLSILGLAGQNDRTDDDSEKDMTTVRTTSDKGLDINLSHDTENASYDRISRDQLAELEYVLEEFPDMVKQLLNRERIDSLADLPKSRYREALTKSHEIIALRKGLKK